MRRMADSACREFCKDAEEERRIIEDFLPAIKHLALKFSRGFDDPYGLQDLISAGILGLLEALQKYNGARGATLYTFASIRIRGAMIDELRKKDWFPRSARTKAKKIEGAIGKLEKELGRYPTEEEVADELEICLEDYRHMLTGFSNLSVVSIDEISEALGLHTKGTVSFIVEDEGSPESWAESKEIGDVLATAINRLTEKQKNVIASYYYDDKSMKDIANDLRITQARVSQIHSQAILLLRSHLQEANG